MAVQRDRDEMLFQRWLIGGHERDGVPFADFRAHFVQSHSVKSANDILADVEKLLDNNKWRAD